MIEINAEYLDAIREGKHRHKYYQKTVDHARDMGVHVEGEMPKHLLEINRPNEQEEIKQYRLDTYEPVTQSLSEKVVNTVNKIFNPRLWSVEYPEQQGNDTLAQYLTEDYPFYRSIINFITETYTVKDFSDPNGAIVVLPQNFDIPDTELYEPVATVYPSETLVDYDEHYYTFLFEDVIKIFTKNEIMYWKKEGKQNWVNFFMYTHNFGFAPVFRLGGVIKGKKEPFYFESFIRGVLPHWNQVVQLTSDLQAAYVNHLYMDKWEFETECDNDGCVGGNIRTTIQNGKDTEEIDVQCKRCNGRGKVSRSPFGIHTVNRDAINIDAPLPTPPAGYIDKPIEVVDKVEDRIKKEERRGLASINMEIVQMVGTDQSGKAKTVDREDLNAFLSRYSRHVFEYVLPRLISSIAVWRYSTVAKVSDLLPSISQPKDFNILSLEQLATEYKDASNAKVSDGYLQHIELEIVQSKFANNEDARKLNEALIMLNPYPGKSVDEMLTLRNLGEKEWSIYKGIHLIELVNIAVEDDKKFLDKSLKDQRDIIDEMAKKAVGFEEVVSMIPAQEDIGAAKVGIASQSDEAAKAEADAKAKLKGSVGGVNGILAIQAAVAAGTSDYDAALEVLSEIFGFDEETGKKILGTKKKATV
jgi:hypothetical protein